MITLQRPPIKNEPHLDAALLRLVILRLSRILGSHELAGLTPTQLSALATISQSGPMRLCDLAAAEGIAPSTGTRLAAALCRFGYVNQSAVASDGRVSMVSITARGRSALEQIPNTANADQTARVDQRSAR
jgi:DNA-binding MarR family transcriptional regulator